VVAAWRRSAFFSREQAGGMQQQATSGSIAHFPRRPRHAAATEPSRATGVVVDEDQHAGGLVAMVDRRISNTTDQNCESDAGRAVLAAENGT